ncbi:hypothetical protein KUV50_17800 [Membranicola marinus]|uniref:Uncharacterized protein n=1 Tax=Membranihabitans marinus TaxID=1227546 RepID=A0A953HXH1_9BACT|nr:hypothetical protein [Membranihabitans marinus]MBY5960010.1 hypothetical protein [Membranihabitans marinus]
MSWSYLVLAALVLFPASSRAAMLAVASGTLVVAWPRIRNSSYWQHN